MKIKKHFFSKNDSRGSKLKSYSAITGAFLAAAGSADAQIIYTDINPDTVIHHSSFDIDFDGDGTVDYHLQQYHFSTYGSAALINSPVNSLNKIMGKKVPQYSSAYTYWPDRLNKNAAIGPSVAGFYSFLAFPNIRFLGTRGYQFSAGFWLGHDGYIGVNFKSGANDYYGWIECYGSYNADTIILKGYAYDTIPHTLINAGAGDTVSVLNPGINENTQNNISHVGNFFPNPTSKGKTTIIIDSKETTDLKMEVMNGMGQLLQTEKRKLISGKNMVAVNIKDLANGIYFVKLTSGNQAIYRKINVSR